MRSISLPKVSRRLDLGEYESEMVRIDSRQERGVPQCMRQPFGDLSQQRIATWPTEAFINVLEPLQVNNSQGELALIGGCPADMLRRALKKQAAVGKSGEFVIVGKVVEAFLLLQVIEREGDVTGQLRQQSRFTFIEGIRFGAVYRAKIAVGRPATIKGKHPRDLWPLSKYLSRSSATDGSVAMSLQITVEIAVAHDTRGRRYQVCPHHARSA